MPRRLLRSGRKTYASAVSSPEEGQAREAVSREQRIAALAIPENEQVLASDLAEHRVAPFTPAAIDVFCRSLTEAASATREPDAAMDERARAGIAKDFPSNVRVELRSQPRRIGGQEAAAKGNR
ncbi:MAG: hypothetical protein LT102_09830 [Burkholderiaceae bacterium]|nr:hypothetical protein [Burkholderiaceae bacterium]